MLTTISKLECQRKRKKMMMKNSMMRMKTSFLICLLAITREPKKEISKSLQFKNLFVVSWPTLKSS